MARKTDGGGSITYLKINGNGVLYETSKVPKEGFIEVSYQDKKTKEEKVTYHCLYNAGTDEGKISYLDIRETPYGKNLNISVKSENGIDAIQVPLFTAKKRLSPYAKNLACLLPNLDFNKVVSLVPSTKKDQNGYTDKAIFINYVEGDKGFVKFAHKFGDNGDIPKAVKTTAVDGTVEYDFKEQDTFLYNVLAKEVQRFKDFQNSNNSNGSTPDTNVPAETKDVAPQIENDSQDDLPF